MSATIVEVAALGTIPDSNRWKAIAPAALTDLPTLREHHNILALNVTKKLMIRPVHFDVEQHSIHSKACFVASFVTAFPSCHRLYHP